MKRREFFTLVGGAATLPLAARAQSRIYRVAFLTLEPDENAALLIGPMRELGYVEGANLAVTHRSAQGDPGRLAALAEELVREALTCWLPDGERLHQEHLKPRLRPSQSCSPQSATRSPRASCKVWRVRAAI